MKFCREPVRCVREDHHQANTVPPRLQENHHGRHRTRSPSPGRQGKENNKTSDDDCVHPQARICDNLRYSLEQLKLRTDKDLYLAIVESVVIGPAAVG